MSLVTHEDLRDSGRVYLGGMNHALDDKILIANNIQAVVSIHPRDLLAWDEQDASYGLRRYCTNGCPVQYHLMIPLEDNLKSHMADYFDETYDFICKNLEKGRNILIHCKSGRSRSVAVLIACLQRKHYETRIRPLGLAVDKSRDKMVEYRQSITRHIQKQRLPVIIITERILPSLQLYELRLIEHPDAKAERRLLSPSMEEIPKRPPGCIVRKPNAKGGAAVLKICMATVFYEHGQRPPKSVVQQFLSINESYFYELEGVEFNGQSYVESHHAYRGVLEFYDRFAKEYDIATPHAFESLLRS